MNLSEYLQHTTIRIETEVSNGISTGTGFFLSLKEDKENNIFVPVIVTNKHVVQNAKRGKFRFSICDNKGNQLNGEYYDLCLEDFESKWIMHPENDVDLCVLPIANIHREIQKIDKELFYTMLSRKEIPSKSEMESEFSWIEDITVVGYPDGIWDSYNNLPIIRRGITATPMQMDFENKAQFLIDAAIYGGSSGSPVFVYNQGTYSKPDGSVYPGTRLKLIGIIHAVAQHKVTGDVEVIDIPTAKKSITNTFIPNNLGVAIHARKLLDFEKLLRDYEI